MGKGTGGGNMQKALVVFASLVFASALVLYTLVAWELPGTNPCHVHNPNLPRTHTGLPPQHNSIDQSHSLSASEPGYFHLSAELLSWPSLSSDVKWKPHTLPDKGDANPQWCDAECVAEMRSSCERIVFVVLMYPHKSGGPNSLHQLHKSLNKQGICSLMVGAVQAYHTRWSRHVRIRAHQPTQEEIDGYIQSQDTIVVAEGAPLTPDMMDYFSRKGVMLITNYLGQNKKDVHRILKSQTRGICAGWYMGQLFSCPVRALMMTPMDDMFYDEGNAFTADEEHVDSYKKDVVLFDNDFSLDVSRLVVPANHPNTQFVVAKGMSQTQLLEKYREAKMVVDWHLPGRERINFESALFHALPCPANQGNGRDSNTFPIPMWARTAPNDYDALNANIASILDNYTTLKEQWRPFFSRVRRMREVYDEGVLGYFSNDVLIYAQAYTAQEEQALVPFLLVMHELFPYADIEVAMGRKEAWEFENARFVEVLKDQGWWNAVHLVHRKNMAPHLQNGALLLTHRPQCPRKRTYVLLVSDVRQWFTTGHRLLRTLSSFLPSGAFAYALHGEGPKGASGHTPTGLFMHWSVFSTVVGGYEVPADMAYEHVGDLPGLFKAMVQAKPVSHSRPHATLDHSMLRTPLMDLSQLHHLPPDTHPTVRQLRQHAVWRFMESFMSETLRAPLSRVSEYDDVL